MEARTCRILLLRLPAVVIPPTSEAYFSFLLPLVAGKLNWHAPSFLSTLRILKYWENAEEGIRRKEINAADSLGVKEPSKIRSCSVRFVRLEWVMKIIMATPPRPC